MSGPAGPHEPLTVHRLGGATGPIVLNAPHAATWIPPDARGEFTIDDAQLDSVLAVMTDWHTGRLALDALAASGRAGAVIVSNVSRLCVDTERSPNRQDSMGRLGMGPVMTVTPNLEPMRSVSPERVKELIATYWLPYRDALAGLLDAAVAEHGHAVLIDLHSYPVRPSPFEVARARRRPGVCIGTDPIHTPPALGAAALAAFAGVPGEAVENEPFHGTVVLNRHRGDRRVRSVRVSLRRDLYHEQPDGPPNEGYPDIRARLASLVGSLT